MSAGLDRAKEAERKAEKRFSIAKNMFFVYLVIVTLFSAVQTVIITQRIQDNLTISRENAARNHQRTQDYIKCVAQTLLKPLAERKNVDFENCTVSEGKNSDDVNTPNPNDEKQQSSISSPQSPVSQAPQIIIRGSEDTASGTSPPATTGSPPDPDDQTQASTDPAENSRVLTILDGILKEVDRSEVGGTLDKLGL